MDLFDKKNLRTGNIIGWVFVIFLAVMALYAGTLQKKSLPEGKWAGGIYVRGDNPEDQWRADELERMRRGEDSEDEKMESDKDSSSPELIKNLSDQNRAAQQPSESSAPKILEIPATPAPSDQSAGPFESYRAYWLDPAQAPSKMPLSLNPSDPTLRGATQETLRNKKAEIDEENTRRGWRSKDGRLVTAKEAAP